MSKKLLKKVLFVVAPVDFRDEEFFEPKKIFETVGVKTETASVEAGAAYGVSKEEAKVTKSLLDVNVADYNAVIFVGGPGATVYFDDAIALAIAEETVRQNKIIAAICIAPSILANAGILQNRRVTSFESERENMTKKGAIFENNPVVVDGKIVTASGPEAAKDFAWKIIELLDVKV